MKFGVRKFSPGRSLRARTTGRLKRAVKRSVNPFYGKKGVGLVANPRRSIYSRVYRRTTVGVSDVTRTASRGSKAGCGCALCGLLLVGFGSAAVLTLLTCLA